MTNKDIWRIIAKTIAFVFGCCVLVVYGFTPASELTKLHDAFGLLAAMYCWMSSGYFLLNEFNFEQLKGEKDGIEK